MGAFKNHYHDEICRQAALADLGSNEPSECPVCDGFGRCWNNGYDGQGRNDWFGQWVACETCGDTRGHP